MAFTSQFTEALAFATELHKDHFRKQTNIPYISHLLAVASIVLEHGGTEQEAIAALLHDAVEDQGGAPTREKIRKKFGEEVVAIVDDCSDTDITPKPPWRQRKETHIAHLRTASPSVRLVYAADKLHNIRCIVADYRQMGESLWNRFNGGKEGTLWYYRTLVNVFKETGSSPLVEELDRTVTELEKQAKQTFLKKCPRIEILHLLTLIVLAGITFWYACETKKMAQEMKRTNQVNLRPFLMFRTDGYFYENGILYFKIGFRNAGNAPARNVRLHHNLFKDGRCIKNWLEPETKKFVVFPNNDDVLWHNENLEKQIMQENEIKEGKSFKVQFIATYNGFDEIDNRIYYSVTDYVLTPTKYYIESNVEKNAFNLSQPLTDEGFIKQSEFESKLHSCKDFVSGQ